MQNDMNATDYSDIHNNCKLRSWRKALQTFLKLSATLAGDTDSTSPQNEPRGS